MSDVMYKLSFFVPLPYAERVKSAVFLTGAGQVGSYDQCSWETVGSGQFRPLSGSDPFVGKTDELQKVEELKKIHLINKKTYLKITPYLTTE